MRKKKQPKWLPVAALLILAAIAAAIYFVGGWLDQLEKKPEPRGDATARCEYEATTITVNGQRYRLREQVTSFLLMGIDRTENSSTLIKNRSGGQADFLRLIVLDGKNNTISQLPIDRDTVADVVTLGVLGNRSGTRKMQISLSHSFGQGGIDSCELTVEAVSNLLLGTAIDGYLAMDMDGINELNEALGCVTVTIEEDLTVLDPAMVPGAVIQLKGNQAELFVRSRMSVGDGTNVSRMRRQQEFMHKALLLITEQTRQDANYIGNVFDRISPYLVSNLSRARLINESYAAKDYEQLPETEIPGTHQKDEDGFTEFIPDEEQLTQIVLQLFYEEIQ